MMIKQLLTVVVGSTLGAAFPVQAEGPIDGRTYGKINLSVVSADDGRSDQWELNSNASRIGFQGKTELSDGLYAVYKAEFETFADDGDSGGSNNHDTFEQRNIMVGLRGRYGTVWAGKHDTPTKLAQDKVDLFNDLEGDIKNTFEGENRASNLIAYTTPEIRGFAATLAVMPGEGSDIDGDGSDDDGFADSVSYALSYTNDDLYLALAGDRNLDRQDLMRFVAQYKINAFMLGFMYQQNEDSEDASRRDESGYFVSAAYTLDKTTFKVQYGEIEDDADDHEEQTLSLGADYLLAKNTTVYAFYTRNTDSAPGEDDDEDDALGLGVEHKF